MDKQYHQHNRDRRPGGKPESSLSQENSYKVRIEKLEARVSYLDIQITSIKSQLRFLVDLIKKDAGVSISSIPH